MTDSPAAPAPHKVTLYRNGSVYTAADPFATAMLVDGDTVAWVGSEQAATSIADSSMEVIDLHGALLAPGFVDSHVHLTETGIALDSLQLGGVRSARELLDAVAGFCGSASSAGGTVLGHGWDETQWADPTLPTREELERAAGGRQVYLSRVDVHSALVSSSLAAAAGLDETDGTGSPVRAARSSGPRTRPPGWRRAGCPPRRSAATSSGPSPRRQPTATWRWRKWRRRTSAASTTCSSPRPGTPARTPFRRSCRTGASWPAPRTMPGPSWTAWACPCCGLAGDLNMDGSIGSRTAALRAGLQRRAGGAGQPVPLGRGGGSPPRGVLAAGDPGRLPRHRGRRPRRRAGRTGPGGGGRRRAEGPRRGPPPGTRRARGRGIHPPAGQLLRDGQRAARLRRRLGRRRTVSTGSAWDPGAAA